MKTVKLIVLFFTALCLNLFPVRAAGVGTLFLVSATYGAGATVPVLLYRVGPGSSGALTAAEKIADSCDRVLVDYDRASLVVAYPPLVPNTFAVLDMKTGSEIARPVIDYDPHNYMPGNAIYILDMPGRESVLAMNLSRVSGGDIAHEGGLIAVSLSDAHPTVPLPLPDVVFAYFSGFPGGGLIATPQVVRGDPLHILVSDTLGFGTPLAAPPGDTGKRDHFMLINDSRMTVLAEAFAKITPDAIEVLDKSRGEWRHIRLPFTASFRFRSFGGTWTSAISEKWIGIPARHMTQADSPEGEAGLTAY